MPLESLLKTMPRKLSTKLGRLGVEFAYDSDAVLFTITFDLLSGIKPLSFDLREYSTAQDFLLLVWQIRRTSQSIYQPELLDKALLFLDDCCNSCFGVLLDEAYKPGVNVNWEDWLLSSQ
jgi:hypothetical protein